MSLVVPSVQKQVIFTGWIGLHTPWSLRIYGNDVTPGDDSLAGDFTQISGGGYAAVALAAGSWSITAATPSIASYAAQTFTFTGPIGGPGTIYGYYILDSTGLLILAERLPFPPFSPANNGDAMIVTPQIQLTDV